MENLKQEIIKNYVNSYNNFDVDGMIEHLSEDIVFENISNGELNLKTIGLDEFRKQAESAKEYFKDRKQTIESWDFNDLTVSINIDYKATLAVDFPNGLKKR